MVRPLIPRFCPHLLEDRSVLFRLWFHPIPEFQWKQGFWKIEFG